jgi:hypothetical protein
MNPSIADVVAALHARGVVLPAGNVRLDYYGDSPELSRHLLAMIRSGQKRAGTGLFWQHEHEGEPLAQVGDIEIVLTHDHKPSIVTRVTQVVVLPFRECRVRRRRRRRRRIARLLAQGSLELLQPRLRIDRQGAHGRHAGRLRRV